MDLRRGMRDKLDKYIDVNSPLEAQMNVAGSAVYDFCCFGVDANDTLSDDRYMVFYNQTSSPSGEITYTSAQNSAVFKIDLSRIPTSIQKLVFTVSIDGSGVMGEIGSHTLKIRQNGTEALSLSLAGGDFQQEKAIITAEIYKKEVWRINAVARGFNGGLEDLLNNYGGEAENDAQTPAPSQNPTPAPAPTPMRNTASPAPTLNRQPVSAIIRQKAPALAKSANVLEHSVQQCGLGNASAKVAVVMDMTQTMLWDYEDGTISKAISKFMPVIAQLDGNCQADFWLYGDIPREMPALTLNNYANAIPRDWTRLMQELGGGNDELKVMNAVAQKYSGIRTPVYVIFVTVGSIQGGNAVADFIRHQSNKPIYWQFIGLNGMRYGDIEHPELIQGRMTDNAGFFEADDFDDANDGKLYNMMFAKFPKWLNEARQKGLI